MEDLLIMVDTQDRQIGVAGKLRAHEKGLLHRAFSIFIFDQESRLLLQQRADSKYHSAGLWSNTCCGHPRLGEKTLEAAKRRLFEEMGLRCELFEHFALVYHEKVPGGLTEYEYDHVLVGHSLTDPTANPDEAKAWRWVPPLALQDELSSAPETFTAWFHTIVRRSGLADMASWAGPSHPTRAPSPVASLDHCNEPYRLPLWLEKSVYPLNPFTEQAQQHTRQWLKHMGLENTPHQTHQQEIYVPGTYAGYMWSEAPLTYC